jgi:putative transcriptional regulator
MKHELLQAMEEVLSDIKGVDKLPYRSLDMLPNEIYELRQRHHLSQNDFAKLFGIRVKTLQQWEQGVRRPQGPASVLLRVISKNPEAVLESIHELDSI